MMELLGTIISSATGTAIGNSVPEDALKKPFRMSKKTDDRLNGERAGAWYLLYQEHCIKVGRNLDGLKLIKFDAIVVSYRRGEISYREFSDELDRLDNPKSLSGLSDGVSAAFSARRKWARERYESLPRVKERAGFSSAFKEN